MSQINLLKQNNSSSEFLEFIPKILVWVFGAVLIGLLLYYASLFIQAASINNQMATLQAKLSSETQNALAVPGRDEALTRQLQIKNLTGVIATHPYWSQLFPELAKVTLKTAVYDTFQVSQDGGLTVSAIVPGLDDLDKYMQVFDLAQFNANFSNIRIDSYTKIQDKTTTKIKFQVKMDYNPSIIKYHDATTASAAPAAPQPSPSPAALSPTGITPLGN